MNVKQVKQKSTFVQKYHNSISLGRGPRTRPMADVGSMVEQAKFKFLILFGGGPALHLGHDHLEL